MFLEQPRILLFVDLKMKDARGRFLELEEECVALLREDVPFLARKEESDAALAQEREVVTHPVEDVLGLPERRLLVVQRVKEAEDDRLRRPDRPEEREELRGHGGLHLVAGEPPGDVHARQERVGVQLPLPGEAGQQVDVEPVAAVDDRQGVSLGDLRGGQEHGEPENGRLAGEDDDVPSGGREGLGEMLRRHGDQRVRVDFHCGLLFIGLRSSVSIATSERTTEAYVRTLRSGRR